MKIGPVNSGNGPPKQEDQHQRKVDAGDKKSDALDRKDKVSISQPGKKLSEKAQISEQEIGSKIDDRLSVNDGSGARKAKEPVRKPDTAEDESLQSSGEKSNAADGPVSRKDKIELAEKRIESEYYDDPMVKKEIARRITDELIG